MDVKELEKKWGEVCLMICTKDRHSEIFGLLQSIRTQTYQNFSLIIRDESQTPLSSHHPTQSIILRMKMENHKIYFEDRQQSMGVCYARNWCNKKQLEWRPDVKLVMRCDDDVLLESQYIEKLVKVIDNGFEMASGVVPLVQTPEFERETKFVEPIINKLEVDNEGNITKYADDCGYSYLQSKILLAPQFRTNLLYLAKINKQVKYEPNLSFTGFREEAFFSMRCLLLGYKIGVDTGCKAFHLSTPSGGCRSPTYAENCQRDHQTFCNFLKEKVLENGNFLQKYYEENLK